MRVNYNTLHLVSAKKKKKSMNSFSKFFPSVVPLQRAGGKEMKEKPKVIEY